MVACCDTLQRGAQRGKGKLYAHLAEDGNWYVMIEDICASLERWDGVVAPDEGESKLPHIDAKILDVRTALICRDPATSDLFFQGVKMQFGPLPTVSARVKLSSGTRIHCTGVAQLPRFDSLLARAQVTKPEGSKKGTVVTHPDAHARLHWEFRYQRPFACDEAAPDECGPQYDRKVALDQLLAEATTQAQQIAALEAAQG